MTMELVAAYVICAVILAVTVLLSAKAYFKHVERVKQTELEIVEESRNYRAEIRDNREREAMRMEAQIFKSENAGESEQDELMQLLPMIMPLLGKGNSQASGNIEGLINQAAQNPDLIKQLIENPTVKNALANYSGGESGGVPAK